MSARVAEVDQFGIDFYDGRFSLVDRYTGLVMATSRHYDKCDALRTVLRQTANAAIAHDKARSTRQ